MERIPEFPVIYANRQGVQKQINLEMNIEYGKILKSCVKVIVFPLKHNISKTKIYEILTNASCFWDTQYFIVHPYTPYAIHSK